MHHYMNASPDEGDQGNGLRDELRRIKAFMRDAKTKRYVFAKDKENITEQLTFSEYIVRLGQYIEQHADMPVAAAELFAFSQSVPLLAKVKQPVDTHPDILYAFSRGFSTLDYVDRRLKEELERQRSSGKDCAELASITENFGRFHASIKAALDLEPAVAAAR